MKYKLILIGLVMMIGLGYVGVLKGGMIHQAQAIPATLIWQQVGAGGIGGHDNGQIPSLAVFNDYLYAGTWHYDGISKTSQIWRSSTGMDWEKVDERPAEGAASMIAFKGSLYSGSWDGFVWSSPDGLSWTEVVTDGFDGSGQGIARFTVYNDTLYASTWYTGTDIWKTNNGTTWVPFIEDGLGDVNNSSAIGSEIFNGMLYWGIENRSTGAQLWRTNGITITAIITDGFGTPDNQAISSLAQFHDTLYAGLYNLKGVQVWRSANGKDWEKINQAFGNPLTTRENGLEVFNDQLYLAVANYTTGMEVWRTTNGTDWIQVGFKGFGDANNHYPYWDNAMTVFKNKLYVATNINWPWPNGSEIWQLGDIYQMYIPVLKR